MSFFILGFVSGLIFVVAALWLLGTSVKQHEEDEKQYAEQIRRMDGE